MSTWVIPYVDHPPEFWHRLVNDFGEYIREVYFPMPGGVTASGRSPQPDRHLLSFLHNVPLAKSVLVNPIILHEPLEEIGHVILEALLTLQEEFDVRSVVVTHPDLARLVKSHLSGYRVTASVLMGIATPAQVIAIRDYVDAIVPASYLARDIRALHSLRAAFPGEIRLMVNEACLPGCIYRNQHFYEMGYGDHMPPSLCQPLLEEQPWMRLTGAWILPQHLYYFDGLYDSLKLAGRVTLRSQQKYYEVLSAYIERRLLSPCDIGGGPASVLAPIDISNKFFEYILNCDKQCHSCPVCRNYYDQAVRAAAATA